MLKTRRSMTKSFLSVAALLIIFFTVACNKEKNREIFDDFEGEEGVYMLKLPPAVFLGMVESETEQGDDQLGNVDFVKVLFFDETKASNRDAGDMLSEIKEKFDRYGYEMAIQFSSSGSDISAYLLENDGFVSDLMVIVNGDDGLIGLGLSGKLDGNALMKFASEVDYNDFDSLIDLDTFTF